MAIGWYACCLNGRKQSRVTVFEKGQFRPLLENDNDEMQANQLLTILQTSASQSEVNSKLKQLQKDGVFAKWSWEGVAVLLLNGIKLLIQNGIVLSEAMKRAYDHANENYHIWKAENPEYARIVEIGAEVALTVIALAVLAELLPWAIEALGFEALGPRLGSWAARWQSTYGGATPGGSIFTYLQRMGMKWGIKTTL